MHWLRYQVELFFTALGFFTRLPIPASIPWSMVRLNQAARYFSLVGWVVGLIGAGSYLLLAWVLPTSVAVIGSMLITIRVTGAFHEDGLADTCDGLGGGLDKQHALLIMKDSRLGTYGAVGIMLALLLKAYALIELSAYDFYLPALALLIAHPLSRLAATSMMYVLRYVREDEQAKAKPVASEIDRTSLSIGSLFGLLPLLWLPLWSAAAVLLGTVFLSVWMGRMLMRRLQGYTGDCLGAVQQVTELGCYLVLLITLPIFF